MIKMNAVRRRESDLLRYYWNVNITQWVFLWRSVESRLKHKLMSKLYLVWKLRGMSFEVFIYSIISRTASCEYLSFPIHHNWTCSWTFFLVFKPVKSSWRKTLWTRFLNKIPLKTQSFAALSFLSFWHLDIFPVISRSFIQTYVFDIAIWTRSRFSSVCFHIYWHRIQFVNTICGERFVYDGCKWNFMRSWKHLKAV